MTRKLSFLSIMTMTALLASGCLQDHDEEQKQAPCKTGNGYTFIGIVDINESITPKSDDSNETHKEGICFGEESCHRDELNKTQFCSVCDPGYLTCGKGECSIDALTDKENCGACGHKCDNGQTCNNGKCEDEQSDTPSCTQNELRCAKSGDSLEKCVNNTWEKSEDCPNGCQNNECIVKICEDDQVECVDASHARICSNNAWSEPTECPEGCENNVCKDKCTVGQTKCQNDQIMRCDNQNKWVEESNCSIAPNLTCKDSQCVCREGSTECPNIPGCIDLTNDVNNCGSCGNAIETNSGNYTCQNSKVCTVNGGGCFRFQTCGECCDPNAQGYVYLLKKPNCQNPISGIFPKDGSSKQFFASDSRASNSDKYCLIPEDIETFYPTEKDNCFALESEISHLYDVTSCGVLGDFHACDLKNSADESIQTCDLGRCCITGAGENHEVCNYNTRKVDSITCAPDSFKGTDCCSGYAYYALTPNSNGPHIFCTDDPNYCDNNPHSGTCTML